MAIRLGYLDFSSNLSVANIMAPHVESLGFTRYWFAEHPPQASPIGLAAMTAGLTQNMRIGTAGVLVNLHNPYQVAQEFRLWGGTFAGRFDAGLCPGMASRSELTAILRDAAGVPSIEDYEARVKVVFGLIRENLTAPHPLAGIEQSGIGHAAQPWILGSGPNSAKLAASVSAHYGYSVFHNMSAQDPRCLDSYRETFKALEAPDHAPAHAVLAVSIACRNGPIDRERLLNNQHKFFAANAVGSQDECRRILAGYVAQYKVSEVVLLDLFLDDESRAESMRLVTEVAASI